MQMITGTKQKKHSKRIQQEIHIQMGRIKLSDYQNTTNIIHHGKSRQKYFQTDRYTVAE